MVTLSILNPPPVLSRATERKIALTRAIGTLVVLALAALIYASFLWGSLPNWVGDLAFLAEGLAASFVIRRIRLLRALAR